MLKKKPPVFLKVDKDQFNIFLNVLKINELTNIDGICDWSKKLQDKLLRYSVPRVNDEGKEFVDVRFFPNEAGDMIWQLLAWGNDINIEEDYFSILKQNREDKK